MLAAAGILENTTATTYWSQIDNLKLLKEKLNLRFREGYPRFLIDKKKKMFTGGGVSSSIDLALKLVKVIKDKQTAQKSQLYCQYQPDPPVNAGDPTHAPDYITESLLKDQVEYTKIMKEAVEKLL